jgi:hypothetical protein
MGPGDYSSVNGSSHPGVPFSISNKILFLLNLLTASPAQADHNEYHYSQLLPQLGTPRTSLQVAVTSIHYIYKQWTNFIDISHKFLRTLFVLHELP